MIALHGKQDQKPCFVGFSMIPLWIMKHDAFQRRELLTPNKFQALITLTTSFQLLALE
jgi:hypothetical protein